MVIPLGECGITTASISNIKVPIKVSILKLSCGTVNPQLSKLIIPMHMHIVTYAHKNAMQYIYIRNYIYLMSKRGVSCD